MYNNDIGSMPPSQNRQARKRKRKIILMLRLSILVMAFIIIGCTIFLIGRSLSGSGDSPETTLASVSTPAGETTGDGTSQPAVTNAATATPAAATPAAEHLAQSAVVETYFGDLPVAESTEPLEHHEVHAIYLGAAANLDKSIALAKNRGEHRAFGAS
jgi:hypothetical protein